MNHHRTHERLSHEYPQSEVNRPFPGRWCMVVGHLFLYGVILITASPGRTIAQQPETIQGRTLDQWRAVIKELAPHSPEAANEVSGLIEITQNESVPWFTRRQAALTLGRIGRPAQEAVPIMERYATVPVGDDETSPPYWAIKSLALFGPVAAPATPTLSQFVSDPLAPPPLRMLAIEALCRIGSAHPLALATVVDYLRTHEPHLEHGRYRSAEELDRQVACIESLELFRGDGESAVPVLLRYSEDREDRIRRAVAVTLGAIGPRATDAASRLAVMTISDPSHDVRDVAATSLGKVGGTEWLARLIHHPDESIRERAAVGLGSVASGDATADEPLAAGRSDHSAMVRIAAIEATESHRPSPDVTAPAAARELTSADRHVRVRAARFLTKLGTKAKPATPILMELANSPDRQARETASRLLDTLSTH